MYHLLIRTCFFVICFCFISYSANAQFDFKVGSYTLENDLQTKHYGTLKEGNNNLIIATPNNITTKYPWEQIHSYQIGLSKYIRVSGFYIKRGFSSQYAEREFVEVLDSGQVSLMRYTYPPAINQTQPGAIYLLRKAGDKEVTTIPYSIVSSGGREFRDMIAPFISSRPDLLKLLSIKIITINNLQTFIHAFNAKESFLNYPMDN